MNQNINAPYRTLGQIDQEFKDFVRDVLPKLKTREQVESWKSERRIKFTKSAKKHVTYYLESLNGPEIRYPQNHALLIVDGKRFKDSLVVQAYDGSDAALSRKVCSALEKKSHIGKIAAQLWRAMKSSSKAKVYRGGLERTAGGRTSYSDLAYERKNICMSKLCQLLSQDNAGLTWGWGRDRMASGPKHVLYVDLPNGQISFHSYNLYAGPAYPGSWDGQNLSEDRILMFCTEIFESNEEALPEQATASA